MVPKTWEGVCYLGQVMPETGAAQGWGFLVGQETPTSEVFMV